MQATPNSRGLGYVDSHKDILEIKFDLELKVVHQKPKDPSVIKTVDVKLFQDKTALRTRKGDTGSVLWKARCVCILNRLHKAAHFRCSVDVGQLILQQYYSDSTESLLDFRLPETQHVLELGFAPVFSVPRHRLINTFIKITALALVY